MGRKDFRAVRAPESPDRNIQIVIHKAHKPDLVVHFPDADGLAGEERGEIEFFLAPTDATAAGDHDGFAVEWIVDVEQSLLEARGGF